MKSLLFYTVLVIQGTAVISARAGLITLSEGFVNVPAPAHVGEGNDLRTGRDSRAELLLNPDTYLRVGSHTTLTLESDSLADVAVRLVEGPVVIDSMRLDRQMPITIRTGDFEVSITRDGLYFFEDDRMTVLDGEMTVLRTGDRIKKGRRLTISDGAVEEIDVEEAKDHPLLRWSERRSRRLSEIPDRPRRNPDNRRGFGFPF